MSKNENSSKKELTQTEKGKLFAKHCFEHPKDVLRLGKATILYGTKGLKARAGELARKEWERQKKEDEDNEVELLYDTKFSIILSVTDNCELLKRTIKSIKNQIYTEWEVRIIFQQESNEEIINCLKSVSDCRIKTEICDLSENSEIEKKNKAAKYATGEYLLFMNAGDVLNPRALREFAKCIIKTKAALIYSDEIIANDSEKESDLIFKPDWSPELLASTMYLGRSFVVQAELFNKISGFNSKYSAAYDYDLCLRVSEVTSNIGHIAKRLYRSYILCGEKNDKLDLRNAQSKQLLQSHFDRIKGIGTVEVHETGYKGVFDIRYKLERKPMASIIIPTKDHVADLQIAINSIFEKTLYDNFEIIILNNNSEKQETKEFLERIEKTYNNIKIVDADFDFNWSRLNNFGMQYSSGDVYVFLNNDVKIIENTWLDRLVEQVTQPEIGIAGGMLLYEDGTIQHAGVVIGMGGWADHIYKGAAPDDIKGPFISPLITRNVMGCTGACMAVSKDTIQKIGGFDERFIVCGSDVEICIRAIENDLRNVYLPKVMLYHYESKSRDVNKVPQIDFELSDIMYSGYRKGGDPYYNKNLSLDSCIPEVKSVENSINGKKKIKPVCIEVIRELHFKKIERKDYRLNLVLPALNKEYVFGGIATAMSCFEAMGKQLGCSTRIILVDADMDDEAKKKYGKKYAIVESDDNSNAKHQIVSMANRKNKTLLVSENDQFMFTAWWTAYIVQTEYRKWKESNKLNLPSFLYLIQDYEPGFYAWSPRYVLAEATYRYEFPQVAIFNSSELKEYILKKGYSFERVYCFDPLLNSVLKNEVQSLTDTIYKRKQILVYGRPSVDRNAFEIIVEALRKWVAIQPGAESWTILSAGEQHDPVNLGEGLYLESVGKLTLEEYAKVLRESFAGISLMVSPHPSYPPLEMSVFDVKTITNSYSNKNMSYFSENITSVDNMDPVQIAVVLKGICNQFHTIVMHKPVNHNYVYLSNPFAFIEEFKSDYEDIIVK
ncbi:glycosyltransferase family 2 protein [Lachnoclostridium sp. An118]|uniref:glycosyltransferase family 2 protein n=1 Tax=Lachnoclostridium sp. An118 TaxID=1965547 RepID=UPI000B38C97E|nr:glycosyltransferase [Lachnoclostridium sp. An118]OUQ46180.1 hypothetical protein B5E62_16210 [Lachnoclostridium sp. An118]